MMKRLRKTMRSSIARQTSSMLCKRLSINWPKLLKVKSKPASSQTLALLESSKEVWRLFMARSRACRTILSKIIITAMKKRKRLLMRNSWTTNLSLKRIAKSWLPALKSLSYLLARIKKVENIFWVAMEKRLTRKILELELYLRRRAAIFCEYWSVI